MTSSPEDPLGSFDPRHRPHPVDATGSPMGAARFESAYAGTPPWDIGRPQPAFLALADAGQVRGRVLDVGCGTGEHALMAAAVGLEAVGVDAAPTAVERARGKAAERGLQARFEVMDALAMDAPGVDGSVRDGSAGDSAAADGLQARGIGEFDTVLDCGLFHVLTDDERLRYVASLGAVTRRGSRMFLLCFSDRVPGDVGPRRIKSTEIVTTFGRDWDIDEITLVTLVITTGAGIQAWLASMTRH
jgi:SAM-dependent methyltransferase